MRQKYMQWQRHILMAIQCSKVKWSLSINILTIRLHPNNTQVASV